MDENRKDAVEKCLKILMALSLITSLFFCIQIGKTAFYVYKIFSADIQELEIVDRGEGEHFDIYVSGTDIGGIWIPYASKDIYEMPVKRVVLGSLAGMVFSAFIPWVTFLACIVLLIKNVFQSNRLFLQNNGKIIRVAGYSFLLFKFFARTIWALAYNFFVSGDITLSMGKLDFLDLIAALFIIALGYIYEYGNFLQKEYDETI